MSWPRFCVHEHYPLFLNREQRPWDELVLEIFCKGVTYLWLVILTKPLTRGQMTGACKLEAFLAGLQDAKKPWVVLHSAVCCDSPSTAYVTHFCKVQALGTGILAADAPSDSPGSVLDLEQLPYRTERDFGSPGSCQMTWHPHIALPEDALAPSSPNMGPMHNITQSASTQVTDLHAASLDLGLPPPHADPLGVR